MHWQLIVMFHRYTILPPSGFTCCKPTDTRQWEGLGTRLIFVSEIFKILYIYCTISFFTLPALHFMGFATFFQVTGPCSRCQMVCVDQQTAQRTAEPLKTLVAQRGNKVPSWMQVVKVAGYQSGCGQNTIGLRYYEVEMEESEELAVTDPRASGLSR